MLLSPLLPGWYYPQAQLKLSDTRIVYTALPLAPDGTRLDHAATEMHCSRVVEPDAGKPRRGARRAARALPPTNGEQATALAATRRP